MTPIESFVIDAHTLLWYLEDSPRLSENAGKTFDVMDQGLAVDIVPPIVIAELMHVSERGTTPVGFGEMIIRLQDSKNFGIASLDLGILIRMRNLTMLELHDRIIVATALSFGARLVTKDETIRESGTVECVW
jgi:PIN domain nuclease of toxin-antitoxin system